MFHVDTYEYNSTTLGTDFTVYTNVLVSDALEAAKQAKFLIIRARMWELQDAAYIKAEEEMKDIKDDDLLERLKNKYCRELWHKYEAQPNKYYSWRELYKHELAFIKKFIKLLKHSTEREIRISIDVAGVIFNEDY